MFGDIFRLPWWLSDKESTCQYRRHRRHILDPWTRKIPWSKKWQPTPVISPGEFHGYRSLTDYSPWGPKSAGHNWVHTHGYIFICYNWVLVMVRLLLAPTGRKLHPTKHRMAPATNCPPLNVSSVAWRNSVIVSAGPCRDFIASSSKSSLGEEKNLPCRGFICLHFLRVSIPRHRDLIEMISWMIFHT